MGGSPFQKHSSLPRRDEIQPSAFLSSMKSFANTSSSSYTWKAIQWPSLATQRSASCAFVLDEFKIRWRRMCTWDLDLHVWSPRNSKVWRHISVHILVGPAPAVPRPTRAPRHLFLCPPAILSDFLKNVSVRLVLRVSLLKQPLEGVVTINSYFSGTGWFLHFMQASFSHPPTRASR